MPVKLSAILCVLLALVVCHALAQYYTLDSAEDYNSALFQDFPTYDDSDVLSWNSFKNKAKKTWNKVKKTARKPINKINKGLNTVRRRAQGSWNTVRRAATTVGRTVPKPFDTLRRVAPKGWQTIKKGATKVRRNAKQGWNQVRRTATRGWNQASRGTRRAWSNVKRRTRTGLNQVKRGTRRTWNNVKRGSKRAWNEVKQGTRKGWNVVKRTAQQGWNEVKQGASKLWGKLIEHGNWCGPGHGKRGARAIDVVDNICRIHDLCYERYGYFHCKCDADMVDSINRNWQQIIKLGPKVAAKAKMYASFFGKLSPCVCPVKPVCAPAVLPPSPVYRGVVMRQCSTTCRRR